MELATGIIRNRGSMVIQAITDQGKLKELTVSQLQTRGIPEGQFKASRFKTDFKDWRLLRLEEANNYPKAFGLSANMANHEVFEFFSEDCRYLVPALAVIRAILKRKASLMAASFKAQGLELAITPIFEQGRLTSFWIPEKVKRMLNCEFLHWLYSYPSPRKSFHSIFKSALEGRIGIELPLGTIQLSPKYAVRHSGSKDRFVTDLNINTLKTDEPTLGFLECLYSTIKFHRGTVTPKVELFKREIPMAPDERVTLSDAEWSELTETINWSRFEREPRLLLDGILTKLASKDGWRKCSYPTGTWSNASNLYQVLIKSGKWQKIMAVLHRHRG